MRLLRKVPPPRVLNLWSHLPTWSEPNEFENSHVKMQDMCQNYLQTVTQNLEAE